MFVVLYVSSHFKILFFFQLAPFFCLSSQNVKDQMGKATSDLHHPTNLLLFSAAKKL
jgi:hypothetical protein